MDAVLREVGARAENNPEFLCLYATLGLHTKNSDLAEYYARHAIALHPDFAEAHSTLAMILEAQGRLREALVCAEAAREKTGDTAVGLLPLIRLRRILGEPQEAARLLALMRSHEGNDPRLLEEIRLLEANSSAAPERTPGAVREPGAALLAQHFDPDESNESLFQSAKAWARMLPAEQPIAGHDKSESRSLRVGFVSADFHNHPVGYFVESIFAALGRGRIDLFLYSNKRPEDALSKRLQMHCHSWCTIHELTDDEAIAQIKADKIDILIDLSGHTGGNRLTLFARRAAPVQVTWLGYFATTAVPAMDYILCDARVLPQAQERYFTERPLRMPDSYLCFSPADHPVAPNPLPAKSNGYVTFGSLNKVAKLNASVVKCWSAILLAVPNARILLLAKPIEGPLAVERLLEMFEANGVAHERVMLKGWGQRNQMLERYHLIDIALDPFPYNGGTTTAEALWMGVPVICKRGDRFLSNVGNSILNAAGYGEWVGEDDAEYQEIAVNLASDFAHLASVRQSLRPLLLQSAFMDAPRFAANLERVLRQAWVRWCRG